MFHLIDSEKAASKENNSLKIADNNEIKDALHFAKSYLDIINEIK